MRVAGKVSSSASYKGRIQFAGVKSSACTRCGGSRYTPTVPSVKQCACPEGWTGTETKLGILADSGPTNFFARLLWQMRQDFAADFNALARRFR